MINSFRSLDVVFFKGFFDSLLSRMHSHLFELHIMTQECGGVLCTPPLQLKISILIKVGVQRSTAVWEFNLASQPYVFDVSKAELKKASDRHAQTIKT
jgi:hypothetical protein